MLIKAHATHAGEMPRAGDSGTEVETANNLDTPNRLLQRINKQRSVSEWPG